MHPRVGPLDLKMLSWRVGRLTWLCLNVMFMAVSYEYHDEVDEALFMAAALQIIFIIDGFICEVSYSYIARGVLHLTLGKITFAGKPALHFRRYGPRHGMAVRLLPPGVRTFHLHVDDQVLDGAPRTARACRHGSLGSYLYGRVLIISHRQQPETALPQRPQRVYV